MYCITPGIQAQFCNKNSCYQQDVCFTDSEINIKDYKYATVHNIYKSSTASIDLYMTVYSPCALPANIEDLKKRFSCKSCNRPFILLMHGGGFRIGCRLIFNNECMEFAKRGYIVATIDYRMGWVNGDELQTCDNDFCFDSACAPVQDDSCKAEYNDSMNFAIYRAMQDASAAMRYIVHYADKFNIDVNYLYIGGHSAGSITAANLCYTDQYELNTLMPREVSKLGILNKSGNLFTDTFKIAGLYNNWGSVMDTDLIIGSRNKIPMIAFHGIDDSVVPFAKGIPFGCPNGTYDAEYGSSLIYARLTNKYPDLPVELYACYGGHGIFEGNPKFDSKVLYRIQKAICFFNRVRNGDMSRTYIRINKNEDDITYNELISISPVNCSYRGSLQKDFYTDNSTEKNTKAIQDKTPDEYIIYPNPASLHAILVINKKLLVNIMLTNANGKLLWSKNNISGAVNLPVQKLRGGLYFVIIRTGEYCRVLKFFRIA